MKSYPQNDNDLPKNLLNEDEPGYGSLEELEDARLRKAMGRSDTEKFYVLMRLMKINKMLRKAVIHHKP